MGHAPAIGEDLRTVQETLDRPAATASPAPPNDPLRAAAERLSKLPAHAAADILGKLGKDQVKAIFAHDRWLQNYYLNLWEYVTRQEVLESYPWNVALPIADLCNARCSFCTSWLTGRNVLLPEQLDRYMELLPYARDLGIQGHGEPLANPHIDTILQRIAQAIDPRCRPYVISNAMYLRKRLDLLLDARVHSYQISLNATTNATHHQVMGLGEDAFEEALAAVKALVHARDTRAPRMHIAISMVLNADNFHEAADFVRLGNDLDVTRIYLRTLAPAEGAIAGLNYHLLSPSLLPDFERLKGEALEAIARSRVPVEAAPETWGEDALPAKARAAVTANPPPVYARRDAMSDPAIRALYQDARENVAGRGEPVAPAAFSDRNPYGRQAPFDCGFVYQQFISTQLTFRLVPCCYMTDVPGHKPVVFDGTRPFMEYWNAPAFVQLRRSLKTGPLYDNCKTCPMQGQA